jgi:undecaprenyl-diphosphatase
VTGPLAALASADRWLLLKINRDWTCAAFDALMPAVTDLHKAAWFRWLAAPAAALLWVRRDGWRAVRVAAVAAVAIGAGDLLAYRVVKPLVARPRPTESGAPVVARAPINGRLGFPSNHAVNTAAAAAVLSVAYPGASLAFTGAAALVGYSRVYVGAHYPGDVLAGFALGAGLGAPWAWLMLGRGDDGERRRKKRKRA